MVGGVLANHRVLGLLGQGGMGAVYRVEHVLLGRPAALKVLLPEYSRNQEVVARFFNEARAATAIRHPGIVEIYDFGFSADGSAYIVMELLDGESLSRRMARAGRPPFERTVSIARQIAGALAAAHGRGIVHRDLKPDNVFLEPDPEVPGGERIKLLDFGIAKLAGDASGAMHTRTGAVIGTPTHMAPEQCRGVAVDHRADLYSLGVILFEMICGRPPFTGEGSGDILAAHIHVPPPAPRSLAPDVPPALEALVLRLLAKSPAQRTPSAGHLIAELDAAAASGLGGGGPRPHRPRMSKRGTTLSGATGSTQAGEARAAARWVMPAVAGVALVVGGVAMSLIEPVRPLPVTGAGSASAIAATLVAPRRDHAPDARTGAPTPAPRIAPAVAARTVAVESTPPGATVWLGDTALGVTPLRTSLPVGAASIVLRLAGHHDVRFEVPATRAYSVVTTLRRKRPPPPRPAPAPDPDIGVNPFD